MTRITLVLYLKVFIILRLEKRRQELNKQDLDKEVESVMIVATPPSKVLGSRKRKRETEEASPSADAVSEKNLKETAPMILARWKTVVYKGSSALRKLVDVTKGMEVSMSLTTEEDFRPQKANTKRGSTSGQTWEVDVGKKWLSTQHQVTGKQVASDLLEENLYGHPECVPEYWNRKRE